MSDIDLAAIVAEDAKTSGAPVQETPAPVETTAEATTAPVEETAEEQPSEVEGEQPQQKKPGGGFQKRISELTREKHEAKREAEQLRDLLSKALGGQQQRVEQPAEQSEEPRSEQFSKYEDYVRALARYDAAQAAKQVLDGHQKQVGVQDQAKAHAERVRNFVAEAKNQAKDIKGFDEALETVRSDDFPMTPTIGEFLLRATHKAAVVKYLADNPDEAFEISRLDEISQVQKLTLVEARLSAKPKPKTSSAPPPPATVSGGAAAPQTIERMDHRGVLDLVRQWDQRR